MSGLESLVGRPITVLPVHGKRNNILGMVYVKLQRTSSYWDVQITQILKHICIRHLNRVCGHDMNV